MHFPSSSSSSQSPILPLALLVALLALVSTTTALPTTRSAATFEPLFRPASSHVGPNRSIERLRQRRQLEKRAPVVVLPTATTVKNPKAKRAIKEERSVVANPKTKRSALISPPSSAKERRSLISSNPKDKQSIVAASISVTPSSSESTPVRRSFDVVSNLLKRFLGNEKRSTISTITVGEVKSSSSSSSSPQRIPNPKSPKFTAGSDSPSSSSSTWSSVATGSTLQPSSTVVSSSASSKTSTSTSSSASSTSSSASSTSTTVMFPRSGKQIAGGYYPDWEGDNLKPENINYKMFDLINYSFAVPDENHNVVLESDGSLLNKVVKYAHGNGSKVLIAIGGWTDSKYFSTSVATANTRKTFVKNIKAFVDKYNVDGVDIDWEYPGTQGNPGNIIDSADTANMLLFLQELRTALPDKRLSTCTTQQTYIGANGSPIADVSEFAKVLDNILVMNYDVWGASSTPGPNAPLSDACPNSMQPNANMVSAVKSWTDAGMPASKILMGVPAYGYISSSSATSLIHKRDEIPSTGLSNRHLAKLKRSEAVMSEGHKWYIAGKAKAERRRQMKRDLEPLETKEDQRSFL
ncbi:glycoside hydrolase family 18 protein [Sporobolomyces salmoneus]|uniref:glycoside hydrolase family 18 protein n=1 Tax=Sporobolomyces salmoneus TaxID=183962 RepID=UPI00317FF665